MVCPRHHGKGMVVSGSTGIYTWALVWLKMQGVWWKLMSMAEELPSVPNRGSCTINRFSKFFFFDMCRGEMLRMGYSEWRYSFMVEYDNSLRIMIVGRDNGSDVGAKLFLFYPWWRLLVFWLK